MQIKALIDEDFVNYQLPSMFIGTCYCDWKCCEENGFPENICQNNELATKPTIEIPDNVLIERYLNNNITEAICFGGLEPFKQFNSLIGFITKLRKLYHCDDVIVIYTGYCPEEIQDKITILKQFSNIIIKYGRYIPNSDSRYDEVLGVILSSNNQFAEKIS